MPSSSSSTSRWTRPPARDRTLRGGGRPTRRRRGGEAPHRRAGAEHAHRARAGGDRRVRRDGPRATGVRAPRARPLDRRRRHQSARRRPRRHPRYRGRGSREPLRERHSRARGAAARVARLHRDGHARARRRRGARRRDRARLPDLYQPGQYDLAGTIVGIVEEDAALHGDRVRPGDVLIGYASNGLHTNGYTLARRIVFDELKLNVRDRFPETNRSVADVLLAVHRSYAEVVTPVLKRVHALAHVTGGGIAGNLVRVLPEGCQAVVDAGGWPWPPVFRVLTRAGKVSVDEMRRVFNLGVGMIAVVARDDVDAVVQAADRAKIPAWTT